MNVHENARLTAHSRAELVRRVLDQGQPRKVVAAAFGVDPKTVGKWVNRFRAEGAAGLADRSSRPHRLRAPTPPEVQERIITLRWQRFTGRCWQSNAKGLRFGR
ncbi:leucine zipper domain-containing protein [Brevundimonas sp.]|uniref:leucine zipper domain-containing protein n=1 Tax=Brevundimonas sp. TaxID=1871086 RepID=UPI003F6FBA2A